MKELLILKFKVPNLKEVNEYLKEIMKSRTYLEFLEVNSKYRQNSKPKTEIQ